MKLYKFRPLQQVEFTLDVLLNERLYCAPYKDLNDPFEGLFYTIIKPLHKPASMRVYKTVEDLPAYKKDVRVCSLTKEFSDIRLWSHYASGHEGVAIEIDFSSNKESLSRVDYSPGLQKFGTTILGGASAQEVLSFKTNHWKYEKEYRIIQKDPHYYVKGKITGLYLGIRVSDMLRDLLLKSVPNHIAIFDTWLDRKNVKVKPNKQINLHAAKAAPAI